MDHDIHNNAKNTNNVFFCCCFYLIKLIYSKHTSSSPSPFPVAGQEIIPDDDKIFSPCIKKLLSLIGRNCVEINFPVRICSSIFSS